MSDARSSLQSSAFGVGHLVKFIQERVSYKHLALSTAHTCTVVIIGDLMGTEGMLLVTSSAVGKDAWGPVAVEDFKKRFSGVTGVPAGDAIWANYVYPYTIYNIRGI